MNLIRKVFSDSIFTAVRIFVSIIRGIAVIPLITNLLGAGSYGVWTTVLAFIGLLSSTGGLHLHGSLIRFESQDSKKEQTYSDILIFAILLGILLSLVVFVIGHFLDISFLFDGNIESQQALVTYSALLVMGSIVLQINTNFPRAKGAVRVYDLALLGKNLLETLVLILIFWMGGTVIHGIFSLAMVAIVLNSLIMAYIFYKYSVPSPNLKNMVKYLKYGGPMVPKEVSTSLLNNTDKYLLLILMSPSAVGIYAVARSVSQFVTRYTNVLNSTLYPSVSKAWDQDNIDELSQLYTLIFRYYTIIAVPSVFGLTLLGHSIMTILSNETIANRGAVLIPILLTGFIIRGYDRFLHYILTATENTSKIAYAVGISVVVNAVLNISMIPYFGMMGAAIATTISQLIVFVLVYRYSMPYLQFSFPTATLVRSTFSALIMTLILVVPNLQMSPVQDVLIYSVLGATIYFSVLFLVGEFSRAELRTAKQKLIGE